MIYTAKFDQNKMIINPAGFSTQKYKLVRQLLQSQLWESEKSGGAPVLYNQPRYLANFMEEVELNDLDFNGSPFTWRGIRNGELVEERIDRGLCNQLWQNTWPNTLVNHATECRSIVESCWNRQCPGDAITRWQSRINVCRSKLTSWSKRKFNHRTEAIAVLMDQLGELQLNWGPNREAILKLTIEVDLLREQEESFWKQRSMTKWLREGDANTLFFHQSTLQRRRRNKVVKILMEDGVWEENPRRVHQVVNDYFINLFTSSGPRDWGQALECIS
ncbi:hypothetical protein EV1_041110 [Malus domestica]